MPGPAIHPPLRLPPARPQRSAPHRATLLIAGFIGLAGCAPLPEFGTSSATGAADAPYPVILPIDQLLAQTQGGNPADADGAAEQLEARAAALRARAADLRARPME